MVLISGFLKNPMLFVLSEFSLGLSKGCCVLSELLLLVTANERVSRGDD